MTAALALPHRLPYAIRLGGVGDVAFVMDAWMQSERDASGHLEGRHFIRWQKRMQRDILARDTTRVVVAAPEGDPETILGWLVYSETQPQVIYYAYVRDQARRMGIASALLAAAGLSPAEEVFYSARPARVRSQVEGIWTSAPVVARLPAAWRYQPRAAYLEP